MLKNDAKNDVKKWFNLSLLNSIFFKIIINKTIIEKLIKFNKL
jgi:hypothetical protein